MNLSIIMEQYILVSTLMVISTVMLVTTVDRTLTPIFEGLDKHRGWMLPILSLVFGTLMFYLFASAEGVPHTTKHILFNGINIGSFSTVCYKIVREAVVKRLERNILGAYSER